MNLSLSIKFQKLASYSRTKERFSFKTVNVVKRRGNHLFLLDSSHNPGDITCDGTEQPDEKAK